MVKLGIEVRLAAGLYRQHGLATVAVFPDQLDAVLGIGIFSGNSLSHPAQLREEPLEPLPTALSFGVIRQDFEYLPIQAAMVLLGASAQDFMHRLRNVSHTQVSHGACHYNASILPPPDQCAGRGGSVLTQCYSRSLS
jgi:hypothetical protein